ncbi:hybrid sensor histidine kinase/response regulator [Pararhodospirillum oryzae]|uniref:histidine kinase n=1 Tax=Pararhodospirillum oryzae TaxID=478448 RepID=A0A512HC29_9PROT|nr:hybrid sensor histidine kinase/response regulator [Pararhodospirillum oryzae]GEO83008.1 hypothetical protein ROR02_31390 [Pararhodospirillum oryzae]
MTDAPLMDPDARSLILIVDDTPSNIAVISGILKDHYRLKAATSGEKALALAGAADRPDLILLDVMMPGMDGYEVCRRLKANPDTAALPVIFLTAKAEAQDEALGFALGCADYIHKPFRPEIMLARLRTQLSLVAAMRQLAAQNAALIEAARLREDVEHIVRHDLKSPLNAILAAPQILLDDPTLSESQRGMIRLIETAGYRMLDMINRSLDLYRMENGLYDLHPVPVDLVGSARAVLAELEAARAAKNLVVAVRLNDRPVGPTDRLLVQGDPLLCHSLLANLVKNALEASPRNETVTLDLFAAGNPAQGHAVLENAGEVPPAIRERFFEKYVTVGKRDGTGLGTYSAWMMTRTLGGTLSLDTSVAGRTRVRLCLPLDEENEAGHQTREVAIPLPARPA